MGESYFRPKLVPSCRAVRSQATVPLSIRMLTPRHRLKAFAIGCLRL